MSGPLAGLRILEMDAIGPVPLCAMLLAGMGADIIHVARPQAPGPKPDRAADVTRRGRPSVEADLKSAEGVALVKRLAGEADIVMEGSRPGVMERLGLGPADLHALNPRLVYGRMTGWGQTGPLSRTAGHDINYIALTGALHAIGPAGGKPVVPLNLVGDYGGGSLFLGLGVLAAVTEARRTGRGQVVDSAMVDGAANLMAVFHGLAARGAWIEERGSNRLDGGAPWYDTYETADGRHVAVGALEEPFWLALLEGLGLSPGELPPRQDRAGWPAIRARLTEVFRTRTRDDWAAHFGPTDACVSPVLTLGEAPTHPQMTARASYLSLGDVTQPAPAPRFERPAPPPTTARWIGADEAIRRWAP